MLPPPTTPSLDPLPLLEHHPSRQIPFPHHIISSNSCPSRGLHTRHPSPVTRHHLPATALPCGGQRPKCNNCKAKGRQCGYDGEEGQSRYKAMKSRLALLEKTMQQLRNAASPEQALRLIEDLKQTPDEFFTPMAAIDEDENMGTPPAPIGTPTTTTTSMVATPVGGNTSTTSANTTTGTPSLQHASSYNSLDSNSGNSQNQNQNQGTLVGLGSLTTTTTASSSRHNSGQSAQLGLQEQQGQEENASPLRDRTSVSTEPPVLSPTPWQLWDTNSNGNGNSSNAGVDPSPGGTVEGGQGGGGHAATSIHFPIPDLETTNLAINEYFIRIDRLFQPFSRDELKSLHRIASGDSSSPAFSFSTSHIDRKHQEQIALSCLTAVASLGSQCLMDAQTNSRVQEQEAFANIARHYLDVVIEHEPLDAVRVCAVLAGTVIMNKPGLALSYVEMGINLYSRVYRMNHDHHHTAAHAAVQKQAAQQLLEFQFQQQQQHEQAFTAHANAAASRFGHGHAHGHHGSLLSSQGQGMMSPSTSVQAQMALSPVPHKETIGHGRSWRTLVFLASSDLLVERQLSPEAEPPYPDNADLVETLTRLCYIKSSILRLRASNRDLTPHSIRHVLLSLRHWYHTLPSTIQLNFHNLNHFSPSGSPFPGHLPSSSSSSSIPSSSSAPSSSLLETHRSIHHIHILYSDSITLLYRWLISQSITCRLHGNHEGHHALDTPLRELLLEHADDAIRVAGLSAVVLRRMIHNDEEILMPCWTAGFQAYTSCAVLLWSVVGKMVNCVGVHGAGSRGHGGAGGYAGEKDWDSFQDSYSWHGELERVRDCLVVLELCARLGGGRDGAERWWRRMRVLLTVVENSATYRAWEQQQQQRERGYHQTQGQNQHGNHGNRQQQHQPRPPLALERQDRSYLLTLPPAPPHPHATGKPVDYALARVSVSLILLLHQSFGAPGSQKLEAVGDEEFAVGDWGSHSRRGSITGTAASTTAAASAAVEANGNGNANANGSNGANNNNNNNLNVNANSNVNVNVNGSLLDLESEQARILEWLGWNLPPVSATCSGQGQGINGNRMGGMANVNVPVPVPVDPGLSGGQGGYQGQYQGMNQGMNNHNHNHNQGQGGQGHDRRGSAGGGYQHGHQQGSMGMGMMRMDLGR
ncbi:hypothetical protein B0T09DRAFT_267767 [Sordaria sp. MPI-SDFR-AT-0083]|nr:hypothetical protein B0T09DRAFT_267767 [Sordaria sp. MPI-SDFR-AT-0083]